MKRFLTSVSVLLCLLVMLFSIPLTANAALTDSNIQVSEPTNTEGTKNSGDTRNANVSASWTTSGTTITGSVTPGSYYKKYSLGSISTTYYYPDKAAVSKITITNNSGEAAVLTFDYSTPTASGTVSFSGHDSDSGSSISAELENGESVSVTLKTASSTSSSKNSDNRTSYTTTIKLTNVILTPATADLNITLKSVTGGSYTVSDGTTTKNGGDSFQNPMDTTYTLTAGTPAANYQFDGWYFNGTKYADSSVTLRDIQFLADTTIEAKYIVDPLFSVTTATGSYTKEQLVTINSRYYHDSTTELRDYKMAGVMSESFYTVGGYTTVADGAYSQRVPSLEWTAGSSQVSVTNNVTAGGEYCTSVSNSWAYYNMASDVIRIYANEDCIISFDYSFTITELDLSMNTEGTWSRLYTLQSTSGNLDYATIYAAATQYPTSETEYEASIGSTKSVEYSLPKGEYLYIFTNGYTEVNKLQLSAGYATIPISYTANLSNFSVAINEVSYTQTTQFEDNLGNPLTGGVLRINATNYNAAADGSVAGLQFLEGTALTQSVATAPNNYRFVGWRVNDSTELICTPTYEYTLTADTTVDPVFAPNYVTFDADSGTYQYLDISGNTVTSNGEYVARNENATAFYTSLADAFAATDVTVLLGNMTIEGNFEVPSGEVLVVPNTTNTISATFASDQYVPSLNAAGSGEYAVLTVKGSLDVGGTLLVAGYQSGASGSPAGRYATMAVNGTVTIKNGGELYGYGLVNGSGTIYAKSGSQVHELCEILDKSHPQTMKNLIDKAGQYGITPFSILNINTIEAKTTYESGAALYGHFSVSWGTPSQEKIKIIDTSASTFVLTNGTLTKYYDAACGQVVYRVDEGAVVDTGNFDISMEITFSGATETASFSSASFVMPISSGWQLQIAGNFNVTNDYKVLPGAKVDVKSTGVLTINDTANLIFYRLNDYDYRSNATSDTTSRGFSVYGYPVNMSRYSVFTRDNVGSAKLNVDGTINANGGLYVTDQLIEAYTTTDSTLAYQNYSYYDNGYNYLTGSGTINMGSRASTLTQIYENLTNQQTRDVQPATVAVVPMKGLKADASENVPENYVGLTGTVKGRTNSNGLNVWGDDPCATGHTLEAVEEKAATCIADGTKAYWTCETCGKSFSDEACTTEITDLDAWLADETETGGKLTALGHTYGEADYVWTDYTACVATRTCTVCAEETEGHTETAEATIASEDTTPATCKATGERTYTATFNVDWAKEQTITETIAVDENAHAWDNACDTECNNGCGTTREASHSYESVVTDPTCTVGGYTTHTCSTCGDSYTDGETAAAGCSYSDEWKTDADNHWHVCSVCGEESEMAAHADDNNDHKCDTCEYVMSECSFTAKGELQTAGTCMAEAVYKANCSVCGAVSDTVTIKGEKDSSNHTGVNHTVNASDATCTVAGYTGDTICECGMTVKTGEEIPAKNHNYGETSYTWAEDGKSCTATHSCTRTDCTHSEEAAATITNEVTDPASCTVKGTTTYTATFDADWAADQTTTRQDVAVIAHTYDQQKIEDTYKKSEATCEAAAVYYYSCSCGAKGTDTFEYGDAKGHSYGDPVVAFSDDGTTYTVTVTCGDCVEGTEGHTKISDALNSTVSGTTTGDCQTNSTTTYSASGEFEGVSYSGTKIVEGEKGEHSYGSGVVTEPTCEKDGYTTYTCQVAGCNHSYTDNKVGAVGHSYGEPQFTWNGYECSAVAECACGDKQNVDVTVTSEVATTATCTVEGVKTYTATAAYNGITYTSDEHPTENLGTDSSNHANTKSEAEQPATCTAPGYSAGTYCNNCQTWISGHEVIEALEHSWTVSYSWDGKSCTATHTCANDATHNETETVTATDSEKTAATCQAMGWTTYTADFEAEWAETQTKDVEDIAKLDHSYTGEIKSDGDGKSATHSYKCVNGCNEYGGAVTHTWNEGAVTTEPECEKNGVRTYTCTAEGCGATYTEEIAALTHSYGAVTYTGDGKTAYKAERKCSCGDTQTATATITSAVTKEATCEEAGVRTYTATFAENWAEGKTTTEEIAKLAHSHGTEWKYDTNNHWHECSCGNQADVTAHTYTSEVTKAATCTEAGETTYTCECGYSYTEEIEATGHKNTTTVNQKNATCGADGYTGDTYCNDCKTTIATGTAIEATGNHIDSETDNDHNCDVCGTELSECADNNSDHTCDTCGTKLTDHSYVDGTCSVCGEADPDYSAGITVSFVNYTVNGTTAATISVGGAAVSTTEQAVGVSAILGADRAFVVESTQGVVVAYTTDGTNYTVITVSDAVATYVLPEDVSGDIQIAVAFLGDANLDGKINAKDVGQVRQHVAKSIVLDGIAFMAADVTQDNKVNAKDVGLLRQYVAKVITEF